MEFGMFHEFQALPGETAAESFANSLAQVDAAEGWGLDAMWLAELHFAPERSVLASPMILAATIAQRTERMKIGTAVQVLPLCHPLRLAEEVATVDQLSRGRLIFGVGRSGFANTYKTYGVDYGESRERFTETLAILKRAFTEERFSHSGKYFTYENVRLLLLSKSKPFPNGLSNNRGQVGRHYFSHNTGGAVSALFPRSLNSWYGLPAQGVAVDNWADDNFDHAGLDFIGGGNLWIYSDRRPIGAASMSTFGRAPQWGAAWKAFIKENADRANTAYLQKTTLPYEDNYLDLDPTVTDPLGYPVCRITADFKENERAVAAFIQDKMAEWYRAAGAIATEKLPVGTMGPSTHAYGGTRMGDNAESNVVNRWGFSHEVPNLGVLGASVMGTSGARNPTLTAQALAWRTAEHLTKSWKQIAG